VADTSSVGLGLCIHTETRCDASSSNCGDPQSNAASECRAYWALCSDEGGERKYRAVAYLLRPRLIRRPGRWS